MANKLRHVLSRIGLGDVFRYVEDYKSMIRHGEVCMANEELHALRHAIRSLEEPPVNIVEIGSYCGGSTVIIGKEALRRNRDVHIYAIEPFDFHEDRYQWNYEEAFDKNIGDFEIAENVKKIKDTSFNVAKTWDKEIDFIFIDGDHEYESVVKDINDFIPYVKIGGLFAFHDYKESGKSGVRNAVNELVLPFYKKVFYTGSLICFRK